MNGLAPEIFAANFSALAEANGGVEHIRQLIIELALHGKLTEQRQDDEPARVLLARASRTLGTQRKRRVLDGADTTGRALPAGWSWCEPQDLGTVSPRNEVDDERQVGFVPMTTVPTDYRRPVVPEVRPWGEIKKGYTHLRDGDLAVAKITPCFQNGKSCVVSALKGGVGAGTTELLVVRPVDGAVEPRFLLLFFKSPEFIAGGVARMTGTAGQQRVPADYFAAVPMPLPPLAEQKRIVAKVDQLMALCDDLEARQVAKREVGTRLTRSALDTLSAAESREEFEIAWTRVVENFDVLIDKSEKVGDLRLTIHTLATLGRLCRAEVAQPVDLPTGPSYPATFPVPASWSWAPLGSLCRFIDYRGRTPVKTAHGVRLITAKNVRMGILRHEPEEFIAADQYESWMTRGLPRFGDVLFTTEAPLGNVAQLLTNERVALAQRIITLRPIPSVDPAFLKTILMAPPMQRAIRSYGTGMTALGIKAAKLKMIPFPVPPLAEQRAIVSEVEQLMKTCDDLEARLLRAEGRASKLVAAVVGELVA